MLRHWLISTFHIKNRYTSLHFNYSYINSVSTTIILNPLRSLRFSKTRILGSRGRISLEVRMHILFSLCCVVIKNMEAFHGLISYPGNPAKYVRIHNFVFDYDSEETKCSSRERSRRGRRTKRGRLCIVGIELCDQRPIWIHCAESL
jgi:hypothetical protein